MLLIRDAYDGRFGATPAVLLENRTEQSVRDGRSIAGFWDHLCSAAPERTVDRGIVLDVQQLHTVARTRFLAELAAVPPESLRAFHIHAKHRAPSLADPIPWLAVFPLIERLDRPVLFNPEVHHLGQVEKTIAFCRDRLAPGTG